MPLGLLLTSCTSSQRQYRPKKKSAKLVIRGIFSCLTVYKVLIWAMEYYKTDIKQNKCIIKGKEFWNFTCSWFMLFLLGSLIKMMFTSLILFQTRGLQIFWPVVMKLQNIYFGHRWQVLKRTYNTGAPWNLIFIVSKLLRDTMYHDYFVHVCIVQSETSLNFWMRIFLHFDIQFIY